MLDDNRLLKLILLFAVIILPYYPASATDMCVSVAEDTRTGKSDANQIKVLSLEACSEDKSGSQMWAVRSSV